MKTSLMLSILVLPALAMMMGAFRLLAIDIRNPIAVWVLVAFGLLVIVMVTGQSSVQHELAHEAPRMPSEVLQP